MILATWTDGAIVAFLPPDTITLKLTTTPDLRILFFAAVVSLLTGLIFGLIPALQSTKPDVAPVLKDTIGGIVGGGAHVRVRKALVAAQVVLCAGYYWAMRQTPDVFGRVMARTPLPVMMVLPFETLWMRARAGTLQAGDTAPDFNLPTLDRKQTVRLSSFRGSQPVVLVFGSYT